MTLAPHRAHVHAPRAALGLAGTLSRDGHMAVRHAGSVSQIGYPGHRTPPDSGRSAQTRQAAQQPPPTARALSSQRPRPARRVTLIVDDHPIVVRGLRTLLAGCAEVGKIVDAGSVAEVRDVLTETTPTLAIVDLRLPDGDGLDVLRLLRARAPHCRALVLTMSGTLSAVHDAFDCGARGFIEKACEPAVLLQALSTIAAGGVVMGHQATSLEHAASLSPREVRVLQLVAEGATNPQIADRLKVSDKTVRNQVSSLLGKVGVASRVELALLARDRGWV